MTKEFVVNKLFYVVALRDSKVITNYSTGTKYYARLADAIRLKNRQDKPWNLHKVMQVTLSEPTEVLV